MLRSLRDDAASAVLAVVQQDRPGIYNIVDDDPAPMHTWLPALAKAIGAPKPPHIQNPLARPGAARGTADIASQLAGASVGPELPDVLALAIRAGFSGTPVWDAQIGQVVGLVVRASMSRNVRLAFAISGETVFDAWPDLRGRCGTPVCGRG